MHPDIFRVTFSLGSSSINRSLAESHRTRLIFDSGGASVGWRRVRIIASRARRWITDIVHPAAADNAQLIILHVIYCIVHN